jgi:hypothetical protein
MGKDRILCFSNTKAMLMSSLKLWALTLLGIIIACNSNDLSSIPHFNTTAADTTISPCAGAITHSEPIAHAARPKPAYLHSYVDPEFGSTITRITGDPGDIVANIGNTWGDVCRNNYMKYQSWNADMSLIHLSWGCNLFLDGTTYEPAFAADAPGRVRWHPTDPRWMIYLRNNELGRWDPRTNSREIITTFHGYSELTFELEGNLSHDGNWIAPHGMGPQGRSVTFAYNIADGIKYPDIETPAPLDWISISPSGDYIIVNANWCNDDTGGTTTDRLRFFRSATGETTGDLNCGYGLPSHQDLGYDVNGDEVIVGVAKSGPWVWENVIMRRLHDDAMQVVGPAGSHTGTRNIRRLGWAYLQAYTEPYKDEVVAVQLAWNSEPIVQRLAYIPNNDTDYSAQTYGSVSPDGMKFLVGSNWGHATGRPVQSYVVDISQLCQ